MTVESPVVIVICNSESYRNLMDGTGYNTYGTGNHYPEVGYCIFRGGGY